MPTAIVLAGGFGTRLRSEVSEVPKPMAPINERPFLEWLLDYWIDQGVDHFILSVGYLSNIIIDHFGDEYRSAQISYSVEDSPLGTGGGVLKAISEFHQKAEPLLLLNGDTFFEVDLAELEKEYRKNSNCGIVFSLMSTTDTERYMGVDFDDAKRQIQSLTPITKSDRCFANGGVYLLNPDAFSGIEFAKDRAISLETEIFPTLFADEFRFCAVPFPDARFIDIGVPEDFRRAPTIIF